ncbi:MAG: hypothetical protein V4509_01575 [Patescibacteria group bacterium]
MNMENDSSGELDFAKFVALTPPETEPVLEAMPEEERQRRFARAEAMMREIGTHLDRKDEEDGAREGR